jgi:hypothetical protein
MPSHVHIKKSTIWINVLIENFHIEFNKYIFLNGQNLNTFYMIFCMDLYMKSKVI